MERPLATQRKLDAERDEILIERARLERKKEISLQKINSDYIEVFCRALKEKMRDGSSHFGRDYMRLLLDEIVVEEKEIVVRGQYPNLIGTIAKKLDTLSGVPSFGVNWLPGTDSNRQPSG